MAATGGRSSRAKGARGELEVRDLLRTYGFDAERTGRHGRTSEDVTHNVPGWHIEVKLREALALPAWHRQAELDAGDMCAVVMYRQSRQPWRCSLLANEVLRLKALEAVLHHAHTQGMLPPHLAAMLDPEWPTTTQQKATP